MRNRLFLILGLILILGYGLFEARRLIEGPTLTILEPIDGSATSSALVRIVGEGQNISFLTINDAEAFTDESGHFEELLSPPTGVTVFTVKAQDRFGRKAQKTVHITMLNYCSLNKLI